MKHIATITCGSALVLAAACWLPACVQTSGGGGNSEFDGGDCTYAETPGVATIVSVEDAAAGGNNCANDPVRVVFDFTPDDPEASQPSDTGVSIGVADGKNPPREWVTDEGFTVGSQHRCLREDITSGTCTPVIYFFPDNDFDAGAAACE